MTQLIDPTDPRFFYQTSDAPYDRHIYRFVFSNKESIIIEDYDNAIAKWFETPALFKSHIEVLDNQNKKQKKFPGGFK